MSREPQCITSENNIWENTFKEIMFAFHVLSIISFTLLITSAIALL